MDFAKWICGRWIADWVLVNKKNYIQEVTLG